MPTGVGAVCSSSSLVPTVPLPASSAGATLCQQVFSASATSAGVANTSNVPLPMVFAVFSALTRTLCSPQIPASNFISSSSFMRPLDADVLFVFTHFYKISQNVPECTIFCIFFQRGTLYPLSLTSFGSSPKGTPYGTARNFIATTKSRPLGEGGLPRSGKTEGVKPAPCLQIKFASFLRFTEVFSNFTAM